MSHQPKEQLFTESPERMLAVLSGGTLAIICGQFVIPPLLPTIVEDFGITPARAGVALTVMWGCAALSMYPGGRLSDQLSRATILVAALCIAAIGLSVAAVAPVFPVFVVALAILGVGIGLYEPTSFATVSDLFVAKRGRAYGVISASYNVGSGVAAGLTVAALAVGVWQLVFLPVISTLLAVGWLFYRWRADDHVVTSVSFEPLAALRRILSSAQLRLLLALFCLYMFLWQGSISFFPTLLQTDLALSPLIATAAFAAIFVVGLAISPVAGALGDRFGHQRVGLFAPLLGAAGLATLLLAPTLVGAAVGTVAFAVGLVVFWPVMTAELMDGLSASSIGADYGITRAVFFGFGSLGPTYVGVVAEWASFTAAYVGLVACFLLAAAVLVRLNRLE